MNSAFASALVGYLLNSVWQVPVVYVAAIIVSRLARPLGSQAEHRVWVGANVLAAFLPFCDLDLKGLCGQVFDLVIEAWPGRPTGGSVRVVFGSPMVQDSGLHFRPGLVTGIAAIYTCTVLYFAMRLAYGLWRTYQIRELSEPIFASSNLAARFDHFARILGFSQGRIATSTMLSGPVTIGSRNPTLLVPSRFLEKLRTDDFDTILAHELAHMKRRDFTKNLVYELLSFPLAFHPVLWLIRARLAETREMVCDEMAAAAIAGRDGYARSLLRLASMLISCEPSRNLQAIGIFDANHFERRVMNLTQKRLALCGKERLLIAVACTALALATCASAIALRMDVSAAQAPSEPPKTVHVKSDNLKIISKVNPVYPVDAKKAKIEGAVVLDTLIGKDGGVMRISVQEGPKELQQSALDAVHQWRYEPYLLNGDPVEVETTITVIYELAK